MSKFLYVLKDQPEKVALVESVLESYRKDVEPLIPSLQQGTLHGDYNEQNVLVQPSPSGTGYTLSGLIDFGDMHYGPYAFELAITLCYMMLESVRCGNVDPFDSLSYVVKGYSKHREVHEVELQIMRVNSKFNNIH